MIDYYKAQCHTLASVVLCVLSCLRVMQHDEMEQAIYHLDEAWKIMRGAK